MLFNNISRKTISSFIQNLFKSRVFTSTYKFINTMKIGTHNGTFHCDEVLACYMLKRLPQYKDAEIVRTRDLDTLKQCDIVVDVGAEFNHDRKRYDHHMREFTETLSSLRPEFGDKYDIKLSSAGLIYVYYGEEVLQTYAPKDHPLSPEDLKIMYKKVYEGLIQEVDAIDNGIPMFDGEPKYRINTNMSVRVARLNPDWNTKAITDPDVIFKKAMELVGEELFHKVNYYISVWLPARDFIKNALNERFEVHSSGKILIFIEHCPWKEHLFDLEQEMGIPNEICYVLFYDKPTWRVQAVPETPSSFVLRKPLRKKWWGVRDDLLSDVAGIEDCVFVHSNGFIGANKTKEGAMKMAIESLEDA